MITGIRIEKNRKDEYFLFLYDKDGNVFKKLTINNKQFLDISNKIMLFQGEYNFTYDCYYNFGDGLEMENLKIIENFSKKLQLCIDKMGLK